MVGMRRSHGFSRVLAALFSLLAAAAAAAAAPRPNILVLFADDLGFNQLQIPGKPFGYTVPTRFRVRLIERWLAQGVSGAIQTPHLAQLAAEGTTFMQWYSAFHVCTPSRGVCISLGALLEI